MELQPNDRDFSESEQQLIAALPARGSIGNGALRSKLGWDEEYYWYIRNRLLRAGVLTTGRGRGVGLARAVSAVSSRVSERDLYDPILSTISSQWVADHEILDFVIECTA